MEALSVSRVARDGVAAVTRDHAAFDLKGVVTPVTVIRLRSRDTNLVDRQLRAKVAQFPQLFRDSPVVIDLEALGGDPGELSLAGLVHLMKACRVVPVGVSHLDPARLDEAAVAGIGVIRLGAERPEVPQAARAEEAPEPVAEKATPAPEAPAAPKMVFAHRPPLVVKAPVRSGQIVYAQATDLIVLAPVNPGAQIVADGHIHCYAQLRGRALAGAQGYAEARIFCQKLEAEMVSIAGAYLISDQIPELRRGKSAQIHLVHGECIVDTL